MPDTNDQLVPDTRRGQVCADCDYILPEGHRRLICPNCQGRELVPTYLAACEHCGTEMPLSAVSQHHAGECFFRDDLKL